MSINCPLCNREFARPCNLALHMKKTHGTTSTNPTNSPKAEQTKLILGESAQPFVDTTTGKRGWKCNYCSATFKQEATLIHHISTKHKVKLQNTTLGLVRVLEGKQNVSDMLRAVSDWIKTGSAFDGILPAKAVEYLKREDARIQLALRMIAILKVQRVLELNERLTELDTMFKEKIGDNADGKWKEHATPGEVASMISSVQATIEKDLSFLQDVTQLGQINVGDVVDKLITAFGASKGDNLATAFSVTGITMPTDPSQRESVRQILASLDLKGLAKLSEKEKK